MTMIDAAPAAAPDLMQIYRDGAAYGNWETRLDWPAAQHDRADPRRRATIRTLSPSISSTRTRSKKCFWATSIWKGSRWRSSPC